MSGKANRFIFTNVLLDTGGGQGMCFIPQPGHPMVYKFFYDLKTGRFVGGAFEIAPGAEMEVKEYKPTQDDTNNIK